MPVYEFLCDSCDHRFDKRRPFESGGQPEICPECGAEAPQLLSHFSAFNKGSGGSMLGIKGASGYTGPFKGTTY